MTNNKKMMLDCLNSGGAVLNMEELGIEGLKPYQWELINLSGYDISRAGNCLLVAEPAASELWGILEHGAIDWNSLSLEERRDFGKQWLPALLAECAEVSADCGTGLLEDIAVFGYWTHYGLQPSQYEIILACAGRGEYADAFAECLCLGALEDLARLLFDRDAEMTEEEIFAL